mmetsp:Transcript_32712/g.63830  ORF Transcript_32712/g.63830 Transcript_32712/m.63830 type:complete len:646 (+) Transcript_32712:54-1991(+)
MSKNARKMLVAGLIGGGIVYLLHKYFSSTGFMGSTSMTEKELALIEKLKQNGQAHLFKGWEELKGKDAEKKMFAEQLVTLDGQYPGGLVGYIENSKKLLKFSKDGGNPFEGYTPMKPSGIMLTLGDKKFDEMEAAGMKVIKDTAFCLVAGGLGERLGYNGIKVELPYETVTETCYLDLYCKHILALQAQARKAGATDCVLPLAIMTSGDTHAKTVDLLKKNNNFGMAEGQVVIVKQEKVPSLANNDAAFVAQKDNAFSLQTKPHGHGDVHKLIHDAGLAKKWASEGRKYLMFFQDTNGLVFHAAPAAFGVSVTEEFEVNSITVPRKPGEAVGAICKLESKDKTLTCNVEYNQLDALMKAAGYAGDEADASGFSPYPGNLNILIFSIPEYAATLEKSNGMVPEFVNPKYKDAEKTIFKKPTRLECMMQDYPKLLDSKAKVGFISLERGVCFSAVKNNAVDARGKQAKTGFPESACSGEADAYKVCRKYLKLAGCDVAVEGKTAEYNMIKTDVGAKVVLQPSFACTLAELKAKIPKPSQVKLGQDTTVVLEGEDVVVERLEMEKGFLSVVACPGAKVTIDWKGDGPTMDFVPEGKFDDSKKEFSYSEDLAEKYRIRGYTTKYSGSEDELTKHTFVFDKPGTYKVSLN